MAAMAESEGMADVVEMEGMRLQGIMAVVAVKAEMAVVQAMEGGEVTGGMDNSLK